MNLNVHFHTLVLDGVFAELAPGRLKFHAAPPPSDADLAEVLRAIRRRVGRARARRGLESREAGLDLSGGPAEVSPVLAQIISA